MDDTLNINYKIEKITNKNILAKKFFKSYKSVYFFAYGSLSINQIKMIADKVGEVAPKYHGKGLLKNGKKVYINNNEGTLKQQELSKMSYDMLSGGVATIVQESNGNVLGTIYEFDPNKNMETFKKIMIREGLHKKSNMYFLAMRTIHKINGDNFENIDVLLYITKQKYLNNNQYKLARAPTLRYMNLVIEQLNSSGWTPDDIAKYKEIPEIVGYEYKRNAF